MNAGLCQNGAVLTGKDLENYSRRKGLCHLCARFETHKRVGKLLRRNQWEPLTVRNERNNEYLVYKGYCIQPTCYTLDQAKELLGEETTTSRRRLSIPYQIQYLNASTTSIMASAPLSVTSSPGGRRPSASTPPLTWKRLSKGTNNNESSESSFDFVHSSRSLDRSGSHTSNNHSFRLTKDHSSQRLTGSNPCSPTKSEGGSGSTYPQHHEWSRDVPRIVLPSLDVTKHESEEERVCTKACDDKHTDEPVLDCTASSVSPSDSSSVFTFGESLSTKEDEEEEEERDITMLPGSGFAVTNGKGNYREALEIYRRSFQQQSIHGLPDEEPVPDCNVHEILFDGSGNPNVRLFHVSSGEIEELELEANSSAFCKDSDAESTVTDDGKHFFDTRASLEQEILRCKEAVNLAKKSNHPDNFQNGLEAPCRLKKLLLLRKDFPTEQQLERSLKKITKKLKNVDSKDLATQIELAKQKNIIAVQLENEQRAEEQSLSFEDASTIQELLPQPTKVTTKERKRCIQMTVFQSAPLAYVDPKSGTHHICPLLDFDYEARGLLQSMKDAGGSNTKIEIEFDIATTDRLSACFARSETKIMHLSCHGHPKYLALENGFGGMQILSVRDLKRFVGVGAGNLELVFVSACHSKAAGKAFIAAGIRHVICCRQDDRFRDEGAIEFARSFYRALALGNTLKQAFSIAREATRVSPMVRDSKNEYEKFILLPELPDDDPYHNVHIFTNDLIDDERRDKSSFTQPYTRVLPRVPPFFVGRETDMYTVLEALRSSDIVRIEGPKGVGKSALVAATVRYIEQRQKSFLFDDILWLPVQRESLDAEDLLYMSLSRMVDIIGKASVALPQEEIAYGQEWGRILRQVQGRRILLVLHGQLFGTDKSGEGLCLFLKDLLRVSNAKVIILDLSLSDADLLLDSHSTVKIDKLDFDSTVLLFARLSVSSAYSSQEIITSFTTPGSDKEEDLSPCQRQLLLCRREKIYDRMGMGIPSTTRRAALDMSNAELKELMHVLKRPLLNVSSRAELDAKIQDLETLESRQQKEKQYLLARDTHGTLDELASLRDTIFPSLSELHEEENEWTCSLQVALQSKQYDNADRIQQRLAEVQKRISTEIQQQGKQPNFLENLPSF